SDCQVVGCLGTDQEGNCTRWLPLRRWSSKNLEACSFRNRVAIPVGGIGLFEWITVVG
ncbi:hypothetical protein HAX54_004873, partial [Datura stramonium]|nr:hypothetical protein [Datura stramonium]